MTPLSLDPAQSVALAMFLMVMVMHGLYRKHYGARCPSCNALPGVHKHAEDCQWAKHYGDEL